MTMVITSAAEAVRTRSGLRSIDVHTDLRQIADLIDEAFAAELDAAGRASLREMRSLARMGALLYLMLPADNDMGGFLRGFVWEEDGKIVGNVTLQQMDEHGRRFMIANVAVHRGYRGQGIGRRLMEAALDRVRQSGGEWALLQVRQDNAIACGLYERMGFEELMSETHMHVDVVPKASSASRSPGGDVAPLYERDRTAVQALWRQSVPEQTRTWGLRRPSDLNQYTDSALTQWWGRLTGQGYRQRWGLWNGRNLRGMIDVDVMRRGEHRLSLLLHPDVAGRWETPLLEHGLSLLAAQPDRPVNATIYDYQPDAVDALTGLGFEPTTVLVTMRQRIRQLTEIYGEGR